MPLGRGEPANSVRQPSCQQHKFQRTMNFVGRTPENPANVLLDKPPRDAGETNPASSLISTWRGLGKEVGSSPFHWDMGMV